MQALPLLNLLQEGHVGCCSLQGRELGCSLSYDTSWSTLYNVLEYEVVFHCAGSASVVRFKASMLLTRSFTSASWVTLLALRARQRTRVVSITTMPLLLTPAMLLLVLMPGRCAFTKRRASFTPPCLCKVSCKRSVWWGIWCRICHTCKTHRLSSHFVSHAFAHAQELTLHSFQWSNKYTSFCGLIMQLK